MTLQQESRTWTIRDLMKSAIDHLQRFGFDEARLNVELLLSHALHCQRIELYTHFEKPIDKEELRTFRTLFERRLRHEPVQYIVESAGFMGLQFSVDPRVFIPRPETETLVEQLLIYCGGTQNPEPVTILDIGTGSGNIAVAAAKFLRQVEVTTIDTNSNALEVARSNAVHHGVSEKIDFKRLDCLEPIERMLNRQYDVLVSNPPYVAVNEWEKLAVEVRQFEPKNAVTDGMDGYVYYRRIAGLARSLVRKGGRVLVEVGYGQAETVRNLFESAGLVDVVVTNDLQEIPRVVAGVVE